MRDLAIAGVAIVAFGVASAMQTQILDPQYRARGDLPVEPEVLESPGPELLQAVALEHRLAAAELQWLEVVQLIGASSASPRSIAWDHIRAGCHRTSDFDPQYENVYESCGIVLVHFGRQVQQANALLEKGRANLPGSWRIPFLLGYNSYFELHDGTKAADYLAEAARLPGAARFIAALAGRMRFASGDRDGAVAMLESLIPNLDGPAKEDAEWRLKALRSEPRLARFDAACMVYRLRNGTSPKDGAELVASGLLDEPAMDEFGSPIRFNENKICEALTEEIRRRSYDIHIPVSTDKPPR